MSSLHKSEEKIKGTIKRYSKEVYADEDKSKKLRIRKDQHRWWQKYFIVISDR